MTNKNLSALILGYGVLNTALMLAFGMSLLGPIPFELIHAFVALSGCLVVASLVALVVTRVRGRYLPSIVFTGVTATALTAFNIWCLFSALAAV